MVHNVTSDMNISEVFQRFVDNASMSAGLGPAAKPVRPHLDVHRD
jgi:hypothetical protein